MTRTTGKNEFDLDRALARLAAEEARIAPMPSAALIARVLADAEHRDGAPGGEAAEGVAGQLAEAPAAADVALPPRRAERGGAREAGARTAASSGAGRPRLLPYVAAALAFAASLGAGFFAGYSGEQGIVIASAAGDDAYESYEVSDASVAIFGRDAPF